MFITIQILFLIIKFKIYLFFEHLNRCEKINKQKDKKKIRVISLQICLNVLVANSTHNRWSFKMVWIFSSIVLTLSISFLFSWFYSSSSLKPKNGIYSQISAAYPIKFAIFYILVTLKKVKQFWNFYFMFILYWNRVRMRDRE